jgi:hypothetical protein
LTSGQPVAKASTYTGEHKNRNTKKNVNASSGIRTHDPINQTANTSASEGLATGIGYKDVYFVDWLMKFQLLMDFVVNCVMLTMRARHLTDSVLMRCAFTYCCDSGKKPHQYLL